MKMHITFVLNILNYLFTYRIQVRVAVNESTFSDNLAELQRSHEH